MTPQFITLPSGLRINTAHILEYREDTPGKTIIRENCKGFDSVASFVEDMTAAELDALLQPQSAIVSPVLELRLPKKGDSVMFQWEGKQRHGVVHAVMSPDIKLRGRTLINSGAKEFIYWHETGEVMPFPLQ